MLSLVHKEDRCLYGGLTYVHHNPCTYTEYWEDKYLYDSLSVLPFLVQAFLRPSVTDRLGNHILLILG